MVDSGPDENVMPRSIFPQISTKETEKSKDGEGFKEPGGAHVKNFAQQGMSVRIPEGIVRKST